LPSGDLVPSHSVAFSGAHPGLPRLKRKSGESGEGGNYCSDRERLARQISHQAVRDRNLAVVAAAVVAIALVFFLAVNITRM
jgi:hypothetical protein